MKTKNKVIRRIFGHVKLTRPAQLLWLDIIAGFSGAVVLLGEFPDISNIMLFFLISLLADAGTNTFNDIADIDSDRRSTESRKYRPLVVGDVSIKAAAIQGVVLYLLAILLAWSVNPLFFILTLIMLFWAFEYSFPPLRMVGRPYLSQGFWVVFIILWIALITAYLSLDFSSTLSRIIPYTVYMILFMGLGETLAKDIRDYDNDKISGKNTTTVVIGTAESSSYALILAILGCISWLWMAIEFNLHFGVIFLFTSIAIPTLILFFKYRNKLQVGYDKTVGIKYHVTFLLSMMGMTILTTIAIGLG